MTPHDSTEALLIWCAGMALAILALALIDEWEERKVRRRMRAWRRWLDEADASRYAVRSTLKAWSVRDE